MRRSGNHAFINWFASALECDKVDFKLLEYGVSLSKSKKTLYFNEVNFSGLRFFLHRVRTKRAVISRVTNVIISLEDYFPMKCDPYVPNKAKKFVIVRSTLNMFASRLKRAENQAKLGLDRGDMAINKKLMSILIQMYHISDNEWTKWNYESWLENKNGYRSSFLDKFNLDYDNSGIMSHEGGGSSFSGKHKVPEYIDAVNRRKQIDFPFRILELLSHETYINAVLNIEEREFVISSLKEISK